MPGYRTYFGQQRTHLRIVLEGASEAAADAPRTAAAPRRRPTRVRAVCSFRSIAAVWADLNPRVGICCFGALVDEEVGLWESISGHGSFVWGVIIDGRKGIV